MLQVLEILFCICIIMLYYGASITCVEKSLCACAPTSHIDAAFHLALGESLRIETSHIHLSISTLAPPSLFPHDPPPAPPRQACLTSPVLPPPFLVHQDCSCISHAQVQPLDIEERYEDTSHHFLVSSPDAVGMRRGGGGVPTPLSLPVTLHVSPVRKCYSQERSECPGMSSSSSISRYRQQITEIYIQTTALVNKCQSMW